MPAGPGKGLWGRVFRSGPRIHAVSDPYLRPEPKRGGGARPVGNTRKTLTPGPGQAVARPLRILFACVGNAARSPMAEGFARSIGGSRVQARSGGTEPAGGVAPEAVAVMAEKGIDLSGHVCQGIDGLWLRDCDLVVTLGLGPGDAAAFAGKPLEAWDVPDPRGKPVEEYRRLRDHLEHRVGLLLAERGIL